MTIIYTGDEDKCRTINLIECPVCGFAFDIIHRKVVFSATIGDRIAVCPEHGAELSAVEEVAVQGALSKAMAHNRGHVLANGKLVKRSLLLATLDESKL